MLNKSRNHSRLFYIGCLVSTICNALYKFQDIPVKVLFRHGADKKFQGLGLVNN